jgi:DNA polymerase-3 subunit alpha
MAVFVLEDLQAAIEVMVFPKTMQEHGMKLVEDGIVCVKGRLDGRDDLPKLIAMDIEPFEPIEDGAPPVRLHLAPGGLSETMIESLHRLLREHPGESQVFLHIGSQVLRLPNEFCVDTSNGLLGELRVLFGPDVIR